MKNTKLKPEQSLSDIDAKVAKPLTKTQPEMDGEDFLADTPEKGKVSKPNNTTLDGEKFLSTKERKIKSFESFVNEMYDADGESPYDNGDMYEEPENLETILKTMCSFDYNNDMVIATFRPMSQDTPITGTGNTEMEAIMSIIDEIKDNKEIVDDIYSFWNSMTEHDEE